MPSLKLGRFNLAKARLRAVFFQMIIENQKQKKSKSDYELASLVFFKKQKPSIVKIIEQPVFLKAVFQGGISEIHCVARRHSLIIIFENLIISPD